MAESFKFELVSPERLLLSEQVSAVVAPGSEGYFTAMPGHAPMMTTLKPGVVQATLASGTERRIFVNGGFADINPEGFTLLAEHAVAAEEIDAAELDGQIRAIEEDLATTTDDTARSRAALRLADLRNAKDVLGL